MICNFGTKLRKLRSARDLSQKDVSEALGISASLLSNYENGERTPSVEVLISLASFYRCSTDYLLGLESHSSVTLDVSNLTEEQIRLLDAFLHSVM